MIGRPASPWKQKGELAKRIMVSPGGIGGISLVLAGVGAATVGRVQGLLLDGATPYNLGLLRLEIAMVTLSVVGIVLELRRRRGERDRARTPILQP